MRLCCSGLSGGRREIPCWGNGLQEARKCQLTRLSQRLSRLVLGNGVPRVFVLLLQPAITTVRIRPGLLTVPRFIDVCGQRPLKGQIRHDEPIEVWHGMRRTSFTLCFEVQAFCWQVPGSPLRRIRGGPGVAQSGQALTTPTLSW